MKPSQIIYFGARYFITNCVICIKYFKMLILNDNEKS